MGIDLKHFGVLVLVLGIDLGPLEVLVLVLTFYKLVLLTSELYMHYIKEVAFYSGALSAISAFQSQSKLDPLVATQKNSKT